MSEPKTLNFIADQIKLRSKVDGGFSVTFEVGEYMWDAIKELPHLNGGTIVVGVVRSNDLKKENEKKEDAVVDDLPKLEA